MPLKLAASLLAADFTRLADSIRSVQAQVDMIHLDIMDGHFVPNLTFGIPVIAALRPLTTLTFDCHLMTTNPDAYLGELAQAGVDHVTVHIEAATNPTRAMKRARDNGLGFGLAMSPSTPWAAVEPFAEGCDMLMVMSVNPGFGGQSFMTETLDKVEMARKWVESRGLATDIEMDGGITASNIGSAYDAGANVIVAGTAIFSNNDPGAAADRLRQVIV